MNIKLKISLVLAAVIFFASPAFAQKITVRGVVNDETGHPLAGAGVLDKNNSRNGTVTDAEGKYSISIDKNGVLEFNFLSYKSKLETVNGRSVIDVQLEPESTVLETAVAIGYGTSKKGDLTGSVSVVTMDDIQETPVNSVAEALQGRVAGADILSGSGEPGQTTSIQIRGARSISAGNEPLIVVDGVLDAVSSLDDINPADIVSISVLKDVSSTAIYGSRGANGVILVTTDRKAPKDAKFKLRFNSSTGISQIAGKLDIMNAEEYATWQNMVAVQRSSSLKLTPATETSAYPFPDPTLVGQGTDWVDKLGQIGIYNNQSLNINGGTDNTNYYVGAGFNYNRGVVIGSEYKRYTVRSAFDTRLGKVVRIGLRFNMVYFDVDRTSAMITGTNTAAAIYLSPLLDETSTWNKYSYDDSQGIIFNNPYISAKNVQNKADKWNLNLVPWVELNLAKGLTLKSSFSFTRQNDLSFTYSPSFMPVAAARKQGGRASRSVYDEQKLLSETTLNYKKVWKRVHNFEAMAGFTGSQVVRDNQSITGTGYINDDVSYYNMTSIMATRNLYTTSYRIKKNTMSVLGRVNYNWKRRYYVTFTARADGASNFSENNKWGFFPAVAFRWSIMNESWMRKAHWVNDLSLRVSAGRSGNDAISSYLSMATIGANQGSWLFGDRYLLATMPDHLANSNLTWETTDAYNLGLNFSGWKSRVTVELDAYYSTTNNLLLSVRNSQVTGYNTYFDNMGTTRNIGVELTLNTVNVKARNFEWSSAFTISHNNQTVVDSGAGDEVVPTYMNPRNSTQYLYGYKTGYPVNALWGYQRAGVWHSQEEIERNAYTHTYVSTIAEGSNGTNVGRTRFIDVNGDGMLDQNDVVYLGNSDPLVYGGFQNDFKWGRLKLSVYLAYSVGGSIYNLSELWMGSSSRNWNKYRYMLDAWNAERNPDSNIAAPDWDDTNASDFQVHDASYLRLKTVTLSYNVPISRWSKFFKGLSVGVTGENLWLLKNYNGFDPDVSTDPTVRRLDNGSFPRPRTFTFNLQLNF
ncbi:MAG: TonB-dependent receptor [Bacteroidales bacterium]|nr:TonB-dependent receptor [Bacteroidales bacterium]